MLRPKKNPEFSRRDAARARVRAALQFLEEAQDKLAMARMAVMFVVDQPLSKPSLSSVEERIAGWRRALAKRALELEAKDGPVLDHDVVGRDILTEGAWAPWQTKGPCVVAEEDAS